MKQSLRLAITTVNDVIVVDYDKKLYSRMPHSSLHSSEYFEWKPFLRLNISYIGGKKKYCLWVSETHRLTGDVIASTRL
jgi:hypothetical protein